MNAHVYRGFEALEIKHPKPPTVWPSQVLVLMAVGAFLLAVIMREGMTSITIAFSGAILVFFAWALPRLMRDVRYREVRAVQRDAGATFVPSRSTERLDNISVTLLVAFWLLIVALWFIPGEADAASSPVAVLALVAVPVVVAHYLRQLSFPRGLTLTPEGIHGVRRGPKVSLAWEDIVSVTVSDLPGRGKLVLERRGAKPIQIDSTRFGSDARVVAHIIDHYRANERRRPDLAQGPRILAGLGATSVDQD